MNESLIIACRMNDPSKDSGGFIRNIRQTINFVKFGHWSKKNDLAEASTVLIVVIKFKKKILKVIC